VPEEPRVVDFARARFAPARVVGQLDVADARQVLAKRVAQLALHALRVVDVVLHAQVGRADLVDQRQRLVGAREKEAGYVEGVDGLDQQPQARGLQLPRGNAQVADHRAVRLRGVHARRHLADQAVDLRAVERARIVDRHADALDVLEFVDGLSISVPIAMLVTRSRITSTTTGT
jgi:hypothetical protein